MFHARAGVFAEVGEWVGSLSPGLGRVLVGGVERLESVRRRARTARRTVRHAAGEARQQAEQALAALGLQSAAGAPVIDVEHADGGAVRALTRRATQALVVLATTVVLGVALLSLGMFAVASAFAFLLLTRGLGLRIEFPGVRPAAAG